MALSKRKPRSTPLQRLSDQRRRLALGGLAIGALFSAAIFRRRWHRGELQSAPPAVVRPEAPGAGAQEDSPAGVQTAAPIGQPEPPAGTAQSEETTAAARPGAEPAARPGAEPAAGTAEPEAQASAAAGPPEAAPPVAQPDSGPPAPAEVPPPAGEPEIFEEPEVPINAPAPAPAEPATGELSAAEAQVLAILAQSGRGDDERTAGAVAGSLRRDAGEVTEVLRKLGAEGVVSGELYTAAGDEIWAVTERGVRRLGAQS